MLNWHDLAVDCPGIGTPLPARERVSRGICIRLRRSLESRGRLLPLPAFAMSLCSFIRPTAAFPQSSLSDRAGSILATRRVGT